MLNGLPQLAGMLEQIKGRGSSPDKILIAHTIPDVETEVFSTTYTVPITNDACGCLPYVVAKTMTASC